MKSIIYVTVFLLSFLSFSQTIISGKVLDQKKQPVPAANIFIEGTYDGATSDENGNFTFTTSSTGNQTILASFLSYETTKQTIDVANAKNLILVLLESVNTLDAVTISAGNLDSGEKARVSVLKPLDIVTTAGSAGDIVAALQTLPGTQTVGESGRLFVRGGEADETQTFVDGIRVAQPYGATTQNLPTRGRFSPFLFSGISFSTGGYSAEYGDALSSVLLLNTQNEPDQNKTEIALMTVGFGLGKTKKWSKSSFSINAAYIDLAPYQALIPQAVDWNKAFQSLSGETVYRYKFSSGLFKIYIAFDASLFDLNQENVNQISKTRINLSNSNFYTNLSYKGKFGNNWEIFTGLSYSDSENKIDIDLDKVRNIEKASHLKLKLKKSISDRVKLSFGSDYFSTKFTENFTEIVGNKFASGFNANVAAVYTEADIFFSKKLALKAGFRFSNNDLLTETTLSPRISIGYKLPNNKQLSVAYGRFSQAPKQDFLKYTSSLISENASHYILNYQFSKNKQTFRAEIYWKQYNDLVKFNSQNVQFNSVFDNSGSGYAKGLELFWRDNKNIKNLEYWVSYSFIDTKRDYRNFPTKVTPNFVANHSFHWLPNIG